ncbi:MAG: hypothetical protein ACD_65C00248G0002 [uncultured bacterium]|nr:MAG: hypothetical protein ACD_65C00248G0002 [uncultured bacterium]KKT02331.1 MAG: hypothetical protein UV80_C0004G0020 [Candidatus Peregrinibacteria bacterium GW2011_GWF2_43_17]KKT20329.1 MAG: hypothetical protein UW03_C0006G0064 [Candidatus Peregrinibacteria bacterium GW2011_GWA2_43_8]HAU39416.1 hypothetical protein [Candidatus Peregrinibacteria bacterium]
MGEPNKPRESVGGGPLRFASEADTDVPRPVVLPETKIEKQDFALLNAVSDCALFDGIDRNVLAGLSTSLKKFSVHAGTVLMRRGEIPDSRNKALPLGQGFLVVLNRDGIHVKTDYGESFLPKGATIGELGFRDPSKGRATDVIAASDGEVVSVPFNMAELGLSLKDANTVKLALLRCNVLPLANEQLGELKFWPIMQPGDERVLEVLKELLNEKQIPVEEVECRGGQELQSRPGYVFVLKQGSVLIMNREGKQLAQVDGPQMLFERVGAGVSDDNIDVTVVAGGDIIGEYVPLVVARGCVTEETLSLMIAMVEESVRHKLSVTDDKLAVVRERQKATAEVDLFAGIRPLIRNFRVRVEAAINAFKRGSNE